MDKDTQVLCMLNFDCPDDVLISRLTKRGESSGRADDNADTIKKWIETFKKETSVVLKEKKYKPVTIDANRGIEEIYEDAKKAVEEASK